LVATRTRGVDDKNDHGDDNDNDDSDNDGNDNHGNDNNDDNDGNNDHGNNNNDHGNDNHGNKHGADNVQFHWRKPRTTYVRQGALQPSKVRVDCIRKRSQVKEPQRLQEQMHCAHTSQTT